MEYLNSGILNEQQKLDRENRVKPVVLVDKDGNFVENNGTGGGGSVSGSIITEIELTGVDSEVIVPANTTNIDVIITNKSNNNIYISFGSTCTNSIYSLVLYPTDSIILGTSYKGGIITAKSEIAGQLINLTTIQ